MPDDCQAAESGKNDSPLWQIAIGRETEKKTPQKRRKSFP